MTVEKPSPLQAGFWLTEQERRYILIVCALLFIGLAARYYHLKNEKHDVLTPSKAGSQEQSHE